MFDAKTLLITGGTGSLGIALTEALLSGRHGTPSRLVVFSRDEAKQHQMAIDLDRKFGKGSRKKVQFRLGDIIPRIKAASVGDIAKALIHNSGKKIEIIETGVRPGEKMDELLITREEALRCQIEDSRFFAIPPSLDPTKSSDAIAGSGLHHGFCSKDHLLAPQALVNYLHEHKLIERNETQHPIPQAAL